VLLLAQIVLRALGVSLLLATVLVPLADHHAAVRFAHGLHADPGLARPHHHHGRDLPAQDQATVFGFDAVKLLPAQAHPRERGLGGQMLAFAPIGGSVHPALDGPALAQLGKMPSSRPLAAEVPPPRD